MNKNLKNKNNFLEKLCWMLEFINSSNIVFFNGPTKIYIRTENLSDLIKFQDYFCKLYNSPKLKFLKNETISEIGSIEKKDEFYILTLKSLKYIAYFILFIKNNIICERLNYNLNRFVYKLYLNSEFNEFKKISYYCFCFLSNRIYLDKNLLIEEKDIVERETKRIIRVWENIKFKPKKKWQNKNYSSLRFKGINFKDNNLNFSRVGIQGGRNSLGIDSRGGG
jgi:hypothetical protein